MEVVQVDSCSAFVGGFEGSLGKGGGFASNDFAAGSFFCVEDEERSAHWSFSVHVSLSLAEVAVVPSAASVVGLVIVPSVNFLRLRAWR